MAAVTLTQTKPAMAYESQSSTRPSGVQFDPSKHLYRQERSEILTMKELNLTSPISEHAAAQVPLATPAAVAEMRRELFSKPVLDNCLHAHARAPYSCEVTLQITRPSSTRSGTRRWY